MPYGGYVNSLITTSRTQPVVVDVYVRIMPKNGASIDYNKKRAIFEALPFRRSSLGGSAQRSDAPSGTIYNHFSGYLVILPIDNEHVNFFMTFDDNAFNAVLSTRLISLYTLHSKAFCQLARVVRNWGSVCRLASTQTLNCFRHFVFFSAKASIKASTRIQFRVRFSTI